MPVTGPCGIDRCRLDRRGYGLIGLLITMAIIVVLFSLTMTASNKAITGEGSAKQGTVNTIEDQYQLQGIHQAFYIQAMNDPRNKGQFLVPSALAPNVGRGADTTASLYSAMIALNYLNPSQLVSKNEFSNWVEVDTDYDYGAYQPQQGQFWDPDFKADLQDVSNASYAHLPLYGRRFERHWNGTANFPVLGNRGPKDGIDDPTSYTYGRNQQWAGHIVFGDGSIDFIHTFTPGNVTFEKNGRVQADNIFRIEDGPGGIDAILGFTKEMTEDGPVLMWD